MKEWEMCVGLNVCTYWQKSTCLLSLTHTLSHTLSYTHTHSHPLTHTHTHTLLHTHTHFWTHLITSSLFFSFQSTRQRWMQMLDDPFRFECFSNYSSRKQSSLNIQFVQKMNMSKRIKSVTSKSCFE